MSIEAMKQALEALDCIYSPLHVREIEKVGNAMRTLRQAIAEAEKQEPVAWRNAAIRIGEDLCSVGPFGYYDMTAEQWLDWALNVVTVHHPQPKREPLVFGLSDDGQFTFSVGVQTFTLDYFPENDAEIEFMKKQLTHAVVAAAHGIKEQA